MKEDRSIAETSTQRTRRTQRSGAGFSRSYLCVLGVLLFSAPGCSRAAPARHPPSPRASCSSPSIRSGQTVWECTARRTWHTPNIDHARARGRLVRHSTAHVPLTRPSTSRSSPAAILPSTASATTSRRLWQGTMAAARRRYSSSEGFSTPRSCPVGLPASRSGARLRPLSDRFEIGEDDARFLTHPEARRHRYRRGDRVDREHPRFLRVGPSVRRTIPTNLGPVCGAIFGTAVRRRGGLVRRARGPARDGARDAQRLEKHSGGRHIGPWRRAREHARMCTAISSTIDAARAARLRGPACARGRASTR